MYLGFIKIFTMKGTTSGSQARFLLHQKNVFLELFIPSVIFMC